MDANQAAALTTALTALVTAIGNMSNATAHTPNTAGNLHEGDAPYNISSRAGYVAINEASAPTDH